MAAALSNHHLLLPPLIPSISSSKSSPHNYFSPKPLNRSNILKLSPNYTSTASPPPIPRRNLKASEENKDVSTNSEEAEDSDYNNEAEVSQRRMGGEPTLDFETALKSYKEAILGGNEQTICENETRLHKIKEEKTDLLSKYSELFSETTAWKEKHLRLQADFENFRKRTDTEKRKIWSNAFGEIMESLLPLLDNFERAKNQLKPETEKERNIVTIYQGIHKHFVEVVTHFNLLPVQTVGKEFDPSVHEAIAREESKEYKEGYICEEFRGGFLLGERLIRPAMVKVSTGPGPQEDPPKMEDGSDHHSEISQKCPSPLPQSS